MSKLLFITQKVDRDDDILGVYHHWIQKLSEKIEKINVVCLYRGKVELPMNVKVFSLGKEGGINRFKYVYRFFKYIFYLRDEYNTVLVHMNPIYIILGGCFWKLWGKKILLWYNHPMGNILARISIAFSDKVFCTSPYSFSAKYKKTEIMPVGIDTSLFKPMPNVAKKHDRILYLGRISPIKKIEVLIKAAKILDSQDIDFELLIIGSPASERDKVYSNSLKETASKLILKNKVVFKSSVPNYKTLEIYNSAGIFVNLTPTGSFDKTILEAIACELPTVTSNKIFESILPEAIKGFCIFKENDSQELSKKILSLLSLDDKDTKDIGRQGRELVVANHSLDSLMQILVKNI